MSTESKVNAEFLKTRYGILRIAELAIALCGIISMGSGYVCGHYGKYSFYEFVAASSLILVILFCVVILFKLDEYLVGRINLPLTLLINDAVFAVFYLIAAILLFVAIGACRYGSGARIAASVFGILNFLCFTVTSLDDYRWFRTGASPIPLSQPSTATAQPA